ncbi:PDDEXK nuclease domain-containing protein [Leifsonia xyli]
MRLCNSLLHEIPWGHVTILLDKLDTRDDRDWYAAEAIRLGWSRAVLLDRIAANTRHRIGAAPSNYDTHLKPEESTRSQQLTRDPYVFDFLQLGDQAHERDREQALINRIERTLLELGEGFAFIGRQKHLEIDGDDFYVDLLFFHTVQLRYVVIELKIGRFEPAHAGQLGFYVALIDDRLRLPAHAPTGGILLCTDRNEAVVRYSLGGTDQPVAVSTYTYDALPTAEQQALPSADTLTAALAETDINPTEQ